ncbi:hypothetical protein QYS49_29015 [Marivirga salinae]|uniref:Uncharacterized protein n=1 Tax=Marivirga salinarum TaxID=3059078 RepID=A0AA49JBK4_9BACT|nr:hypothetical protein [Marivirga sp. BDSF4-3]WKK75515.1 hypothetical protein QYS49_29015 [Marivirga sp. BDSF4-3]
MIFDDCVGENAETIELYFGDERSANVNIEPTTTSFSIVNFRSDLAVASTAWGDDLDGNPIAVEAPDD